MIIGYILLGVIAFGVIMGAAGIMGLLYAKFWDKAFVPDFAEDIDKELDLQWAIKEIKRHDRFVGIRRYTGREPNGQWFKSLHIQVYKWYDKEIIRWNIKKGLWD